jgi:hypothetical protein
MRVLDIAVKDLKQASRSLSIYFFMFGVPILVTLLFFLIFGGLASDGDGGFELPRSTVLVANLDQGRLPDALRGPVAGLEGTGGATSMGELLLQVLHNEIFAGIMEVSAAADAAAARTAVDEGSADVAVIIPAGFTGALLEQGGSREIPFTLFLARFETAATKTAGVCMSLRLAPDIME